MEGRGMTPTVTLLDGRAQLYLGDCREILPTLHGVDAVVTDPPYGIGYQHSGGGLGKHSVRNLDAVVGDDRPFDPSPLLGFREVVLWGANHYASALPHGRWLAWDKLAGVAEFDSFSDVEFAWRKGRGKDRVFSHLWKGIAKASEKGGKERWHPTQKPIALMRWCVDQLPVDCVTVADPFMGSGTTGIAAIAAGRRFVGVEIERKWFDIACRRIEEASRQNDLFIAPAAAPPATQESLL
jgi:site-specific DNA-methyltransferase (adenine-specific)/modification methylase